MGLHKLGDLLILDLNFTNRYNYPISLPLPELYGLPWQIEIISLHNKIIYDNVPKINRQRLYKYTTIYPNQQVKFNFVLNLRHFDITTSGDYLLKISLYDTQLPNYQFKLIG